MSLSCLTCRPLSRSSSENEQTLGVSKCCGGGWSQQTTAYAHLSKSGPIGSSSSATEAVKKAHHRKVASNGGEPRLMRSGGMRRDWSFEDLRSRQAAAAAAAAHTSQLGRERRG